MHGEFVNRQVWILRRSALFAGMLLALGVALAAAGWNVAVEALGALLFGWWSYMMRVLPRVTVSRDGLVTFLVCAVVFVAGLHCLLRWLYREMRGAIPRWRPRWTLSIIAVIVLMFASGIAMVGVIHQTGWLFAAKNRLVVERRVENGWEITRGTVGSLKMIGLAVHNFESANDTIPGNDPARPKHSWQTFIMPFLPTSMEGIDLTIPWDHPHNSPAFKSVIPYYLNSSIVTTRDPRGYALSHYAGNLHVFSVGGPKGFKDFKDGLGRTMMAGEVASGFKPWGDPDNLRDPSFPFDGSPGAFGSPQGGGANVLMMDGSVKFVSDRADPKILRAMSGAGNRPKSLPPVKSGAR